MWLLMNILKSEGKSILALLTISSFNILIKLLCDA